MGRLRLTFGCAHIYQVMSFCFIVYYLLLKQPVNANSCGIDDIDCYKDDMPSCNGSLLLLRGVSSNGQRFKNI